MREGGGRMECVGERDGQHAVSTFARGAGHTHEYRASAHSTAPPCASGQPALEVSAAARAKNAFSGARGGGAAPPPPPPPPLLMWIMLLLQERQEKSWNWKSNFNFEALKLKFFKCAEARPRSSRLKCVQKRWRRPLNSR